MDDGALDAEGWFDEWEGEVVVEAGSGPDGARFGAPVAELKRLAEVGTGAMLEEAFEVGTYGGVAGLDGEDEVGATPMEVVCEGAFGLSRSAEKSSVEPDRFARGRLSARANRFRVRSFHTLNSWFISIDNGSAAVCTRDAWPGRRGERARDR